MSAAPPFRCAAASLSRAEDLAGSASTVRAFLLLENAGPWGVHALREARLPTEVLDRLRLLERAHRVRPLLIRPCGRRTPGSVRVFAAWTAGAQPRLETAVLDDPRALLDLDPAALAGGRAPGFAPADRPFVGVCTHGRHDACCAERGRPLAQALADEAPELVWEVSHVGGDRFAPNVLVLPHGLYYGRLDPADAPAFVDRVRRGELDLDHLRGRSCLPFPAQVAEVALRRHLDDDDARPYQLLAHHRDEGFSRVVLAADGRRWQVDVAVRAARAERLTCRSAVDSAAPAYDVVGLTTL